MSITREDIKETLRQIMSEESDYQKFFRKALEKAGKSIPSMSDEEKKEFFNKIDKAWSGKGEKKNEGNAFGAAVTKAKEKGEDEFEVDGKTYKVESVNERLSKDKKINGKFYSFQGSHKFEPKALIISKNEWNPTKYDTKVVKEKGKYSVYVRLKESVNEASKLAMGIAGFTGTRGVAVDDFIDKHNIDAKKLFNFVKKGNLKDRMAFVSAIAGRPNNKMFKMITKQFGESVNENAYKDWLKRNNMKDNRDNQSLYHYLLKKHKSVSNFPKHYESVNEGNVKLSSSAKKYWNTPSKKLFGGGYNLYDNIPPSQWNTHPEIIDGYGQNAGVDIFKGFIRDNIDGKGYLDSKIAKMIGLPTNVSIIDYLNDGGSGLNGNKNFKKYGNWFSALYDIYEEMEKKFGKMKAESGNEGRAFVQAARKAKEEGKTEFEFNGKTYPVTLKETTISERRLGKVDLLRSVEDGETSRVEGVKISKDLAFELRMFLQRPLLARTRTGIAIDNAQMKDAISMLAKVGVHKRLSSGVKKEFADLLKKYK